ncbi:hypothetical protein HDZ31DRAFT_66503 [Schizophyllum fasciatum]
MAFNPPPPYDPTDKNGFSYKTVNSRWPVILTGVIDTLCNVNHELHVKVSAADAAEDVAKDSQAKISKGKAVIEKISKLKYEMARDKELETLSDDGEPHISLYNSRLEELKKEGKHTWYTAPWLFAECYLYRLLRNYFVTAGLSDYDPFYKQKIETFEKSSAAVLQLTSTLHMLESSPTTDPAGLEILFKEMIQMCLWGNATDLSLLTHLTVEDIARLQSVGREEQEKRAQFILRDDQRAIWQRLQNMGGKKRVDFVLDNAGFELFTDLVFADFLVTYTPYVDKVVFHPKLIPWFVSDVTPPDFNAAIEALARADFFPSSQASEAGAVQQVVSRWKKYLTDDTFSLSVPLDTPLGGDGQKGIKAEFWTSPHPYWNMRTEAPSLWRELHEESGMVFFKGDLNYRKLTGDVKWPASTPFETALGPLAGTIPVAALRTNKADVIVGLPEDVAARLDETEGIKWRTDGRYAVVELKDRD